MCASVIPNDYLWLSCTDVLRCTYNRERIFVKLCLSFVLLYVWHREKEVNSLELIILNHRKVSTLQQSAKGKMMAKWTSFWGCVCFFSLCFQLCESLRLVKRQEGDNPLLPVSTTNAVDNPAQTTQTFDQFLEEMFKDLGIDPNKNGTDSAENKSEAGATQVTTLSTSIRQILNRTLPTTVHFTPSGATQYPNEANISSIPPEDLQSMTTTTTAAAASMWLTETTSGPTETSLNNENCRVNPTLSDFCILPEEITNFLGPSATLHDLSDYLVSMEVVHMLTEECPPGSWCLDSVHAFHHLEEKIAFWSNSSDFMNLCWQPIDGCLRSVVDYFTGCDVYQVREVSMSEKCVLVFRHRCNY